jgi:hypothetical protein
VGTAEPREKTAYQDRDDADPVYRNALSKCGLRIFTRRPNVEAEASAEEKQGNADAGDHANVDEGILAGE